MYEDTVRRLRNASVVNKGLAAILPNGSGNATAELFDEAADAIEGLSKPRWIPVTERLPEFDKKVLAWVENKDPNSRFNGNGIYVAELEDKEPKPDPEGKKNFWGIPGYDSVWTVWSWSYFSEPNVQFWMPLPEPPKEEV